MRIWLSVWINLIYSCFFESSHRWNMDFFIRYGSFILKLERKEINFVENYFSTLASKHEIETNENTFIQWPRLFKFHKYFMRVQLVDLIRCRGFLRGWNNGISLSKERNTCLILYIWFISLRLYPSFPLIFNANQHPSSFTRNYS